MDGSGVVVTASHDPLTGKFAPGNSEYRAKQRRVAELLDQLIAQYGPVTPAQRQLLRVCSAHLYDAGSSRSPLIRTRASRAANQILKLFPRPKAPAPAPGPATVDEYFSNGK
jgi:hypothetical protein